MLTGSLLAACGESDDGNVLVGAAASLAEAFDALGEIADEAGVDPDYSFAGSQVLVEQARRGAPLDVVAVADPELLEDVGGAVVFARNRLVAVARTGAEISSVDDLASPGLRVVLASAAVPAGAYARRGLDRLGILAGVLDNVVSNEADVKAVAAKVALGEADAGVVYATDARADGRLVMVGPPLPVAATYAAAVTEDAPHPRAARRFVEFLTSPEAVVVLGRFGFTPP